MAAHCSILAWRSPWMRSLVSYSPRAHKESDRTEWLTLTKHTHVYIYSYVYIDMYALLQYTYILKWSMQFSYQFILHSYVTSNHNHCHLYWKLTFSTSLLSTQMFSLYVLSHYLRVSVAFSMFLVFSRNFFGGDILNEIKFKMYVF